MPGNGALDVSKISVTQNMTFLNLCQRATIWIAVGARAIQTRNHDSTLFKLGSGSISTIQNKRTDPVISVPFNIYGAKVEELLAVASEFKETSPSTAVRKIKTWINEELRKISDNQNLGGAINISYNKL